eukprot:COSAG02_NODE_52145_length_309_cov_1.257143_1_plen_44_part_10
MHARAHAYILMCKMMMMMVMMLGEVPVQAPFRGSAGLVSRCCVC